MSRASRHGRSADPSDMDVPDAGIAPAATSSTSASGADAVVYAPRYLSGTALIAQDADRIVRWSRLMTDTRPYGLSAKPGADRAFLDALLEADVLRPGDLDGLMETCWHDGSKVVLAAFGHMESREAHIACSVHGRDLTSGHGPTPQAVDIGESFPMSVARWARQDADFRDAGGAAIGVLSRADIMRYLAGTTSKAFVAGLRAMRSASPPDATLRTMTTTKCEAAVIDAARLALQDLVVTEGRLDASKGCMGRSAAALTSAMSAAWMKPWNRERLENHVESDESMDSAWLKRWSESPDTTMAVDAHTGILAGRSTLMSLVIRRDGIRADVDAAPAWAKPFVRAWASVRMVGLDKHVEAEAAALRKTMMEADGAFEGMRRGEAQALHALWILLSANSRGPMWGGGIMTIAAMSDSVDAAMHGSLASGAESGDVLSRRIEARMRAIETGMMHIAENPDEVRSPTPDDPPHVARELELRSKTFRKLIMDTIALIPHGTVSDTQAAIAQDAYRRFFDVSRKAITASALRIMGGPDGGRMTFLDAKRAASKRLRCISLAVTKAIVDGKNPAAAASGVFVRFAENDRSGRAKAMAGKAGRERVPFTTDADPEPRFRTFQDHGDRASIWMAPLEELFHLDLDPQLLSESVAYGRTVDLGAVIVHDARDSTDIVKHANASSIITMAGDACMANTHMTDTVSSMLPANESLLSRMGRGMDLNQYMRPKYERWRRPKTDGPWSAGTWGPTDVTPTDIDVACRLGGDDVKLHLALKEHPLIVQAMHVDAWSGLSWGGPAPGGEDEDGRPMLEIILEIFKDPDDRDRLIADLMAHPWGSLYGDLIRAIPDDQQAGLMRDLCAHPWWKKNGILIQAISESQGRHPGGPEGRADADIVARLQLERLTGANWCCNLGITGEDDGSGSQEFIVTTGNHMDPYRTFLFDSTPILPPSVAARSGTA